MTQLAGKVALVTGGSRGIGAAIALRLAREGADVVLTYAGSEERAHAVASEIVSLGRRALAIRANSANPLELKQAVDRAAREFGRLDILVNNAGVATRVPTQDLSLEEIDRVLAVNTRAPLLAVQAAVPYMKSGARIISIGSNLAERVPFGGITLYAMSKSALLSMTKGLSRELGPQGITVNLVNPGSTDTDMNPADGPTADAQRAFSSLDRFGAPEDVASAVAFLAGEGAKSITGASLLVDSGVNA